jgi:hypothetical protein
LTALGRIDAVEANALAVNLNGVAVDDGSDADDAILGRSRPAHKNRQRSEAQEAARLSQQVHEFTDRASRVLTKRWYRLIAMRLNGERVAFESTLRKNLHPRRKMTRVAERAMY